ncbi:MAG: cyclic nucleotide-binding domain-containing protein [Ignavibacteriales bacterium]|nr:cyclic nucleotide-binding domain-containing protein [Ignavibacteriales bacterium]
METLEPILAQHPFLAGLKKEYMDLVVGCASNVRVNADDLFFHEGDEADKFYIVRSGKIVVEMHVPGKGGVGIQTLSDGDVLGWSWLFPPYKWHFDARALELTRAIALDGKCLRNKCENDTGLGYELLKRFSQVMENRISSMRIQLLDMYGEK